MPQILRTFTFWTRADSRAHCEEYLEAHVLSALRGKPGCIRSTAIYRTREDGLLEVVVASAWESMAHIEASIGDEPNNPIGLFCQELLLDREPQVRHAVLDAGDDFERSLLLDRVETG